MRKRLGRELKTLERGGGIAYYAFGKWFTRPYWAHSIRDGVWGIPWSLIILLKQKLECPLQDHIATPHEELRKLLAKLPTTPH